MDEKKIDWLQAATDYITRNMSYREICDKYGVSMSSVGRHSKAEGWREKRQKHAKKMTDRLSKAEERRLVKRRGRYQAIEDKLLSKLEQAVDELDLALKTEVVKTKTIEYNNELRPDKPTKEIIEEKQEIKAVRVMIDRTGLAAVTNALEKLKGAQGVRSTLDDEEQRARIAALRARCETDKDAPEQISIEFADGMGDYAK